jgi:hypothetical protein
MLRRFSLHFGAYIHRDAQNPNTDLLYPKIKKFYSPKISPVFGAYTQMFVDFSLSGK